MANCPKCGYKLRLFDIKAECPKCGVNLMYYNHQERLQEDADKAEEEHVRMQPKIDRVKFSFIGTKLSIVRLVLLLVPIGMLFLPLAHVTVNMPFKTIDTNVSILNIVMDVIMEMDFGLVFDMIAGSQLTRIAFVFYLLSMVFVLVAAVFAILNIPFDSVSCSEKGFKRNVTLSSCGIAFTVLSIISFLVFNSQLTKAFGGVYSGNIGIGAFLVIIAFIAIIIINIAIKKENAPIKYKDLSECIERLEKRKQELALIEEEAERILAEKKKNA